MKLFIAWLAAAAVLIPVTTVAQPLPDNTMRIVVGFPPGGNVDVLARILSQEASKILKKTIVVESRPGGGGAVGAESVARATPDGSTLLLASSANAILPALNKKLRYDAFSDFEWIGTYTSYPLIVTVGKDSPYQTLGALIALAKQAPDKVSYGSPGVGSAQHLTSELLANAAGAKLLNVTYKGELSALTDMLGGRVDFMVVTAPSALARVRSGELRALAVSSGTRWDALPEVPTVAESGYPGFDITSWLGLAAPKGTPPAEVARIADAFLQAQKLPEVRRQIEATGVEIKTRTPAQTREFVQRDLVKWQELVNKANVQPE